MWLGLDQDQTKWFANTFFPTHGPCHNFHTAVRGQTAGAIMDTNLISNPDIISYSHTHTLPGSIHGYEHHSQTDVYNVSCTQGWTCANMVARYEAGH